MRPPKYLHCISLTIFPFLGHEAAAQTARSTCASADLEAILFTSSTSTAVQNRLVEEFKVQYKLHQEFVAQRKQAGDAWNEAKQEKRPASEIDASFEKYKQAIMNERHVAKPLHYTYDLRKQSEFNHLMGRINNAYKRVGADLGFKILLQKGQDEPAFMLVPGSSRRDCIEEVDLTSRVIQLLDQEDAARQDVYKP